MDTSYTVFKCKCQNKVLVLSEVFSERSQVTMREMFPEMFLSASSKPQAKRERRPGVGNESPNRRFF